MELRPVEHSEIHDIDHQLMDRCAKGDTQAFRNLVERHQNAVIGTISKMLGDSRESEDIAQMVFLRIWKHARNYKPDHKFTTYLYTIVRNLVFNESRRRNNKQTLSSDAREDEQHLQIPDEAHSTPDADLLERELQSAIDTAIEALPENQRLAVILRRYEDLSYEEIANVLETSVSSVKSLLFRARTNLRNSLSIYLGKT